MVNGDRRVVDVVWYARADLAHLRILDQWYRYGSAKYSHGFCTYSHISLEAMLSTGV